MSDMTRSDDADETGEWRDLNVARDGRVYVQRDLCETCVFRPGNLMNLRPGALAHIVRENIANVRCADVSRNALH